MTGEKPSNGELALMINQLTKESVDRLERIEIQTTRTNGRVDELEKWRNQNEGPLNQLKRDRENQFKKYSDLAWKLATAAVLAISGFKMLD